MICFLLLCNTIVTIVAAIQLHVVGTDSDQQLKKTVTLIPTFDMFYRFVCCSELYSIFL